MQSSVSFDDTFSALTVTCSSSQSAKAKENGKLESDKNMFLIFDLVFAIRRFFNFAHSKHQFKIFLKKTQSSHCSQSTI